MFISSTILAVLFLVAITTWNELGSRKLGVNLANVLGIAFIYKICGFIFLYMWVRWTIPDLDTIN
jgi:NADH-quinone oxidoreductase subunit H